MIEEIDEKGGSQKQSIKKYLNHSKYNKNFLGHFVHSKFFYGG